MNIIDGPAPSLQPDAASADFFDYAARGLLLLRRCRACSAFRGPQSAVCWNCRATPHDRVASAGTGILVSWSVVHRSPVPEIPAPYVAAIVEVDEGPWILTRLMTDSVTDPLHAGDPIEIAAIAGDENVVVARPARR